MLSEETDGAQVDIDKDNFVGLLDLLYEEWIANENSIMIQSQAKAFATSDVLDIIQTVYYGCFKNDSCLEVSISEVQKGTLNFISHRERVY